MPGSGVPSPVVSLNAGPVEAAPWAPAYWWIVRDPLAVVSMFPFEAAIVGAARPKARMEEAMSAESPRFARAMGALLSSGCQSP